jgi:hypothetical protein
VALGSVIVIEPVVCTCSRQIGITDAADPRTLPYLVQEKKVFRPPA